MSPLHVGEPIYVNQINVNQSMCQPMCRRPSTIFFREALYAGKIVLMNPTSAATSKAAAMMPSEGRGRGKKPAKGALEMTNKRNDAARLPSNPPINEIVIASPTYSDRILP